MLFIAMATGCSASIWQSKIPPHLQGRVFSARLVICQVGCIIALPLGGILADRIFEPLMSGSSFATRLLTPLVGGDPGAGMGLMFIVFGLLGAFAATGGYLYQPVRDIERIIPDFDAEDGSQDL